VPRESYGNFPKTCCFSPFQESEIVWLHHMSNFLDLLMKFGPKILWFALFPMELVTLNLEFSSFRYDSFTKNTYLRLVYGLVQNPNFHNVYF
jgi:hypothetical protein